MNFSLENFYVELRLKMFPLLDAQLGTNFTHLSHNSNVSSFTKKKDQKKGEGSFIKNQVILFLHKNIQKKESIDGKEKIKQVLQNF